MPNAIGKLSEQYAEVARRRAAGQTLSAIARDLGVSLDTLRRWRKTPDYQRQAVAAQAEVEDLTRERLRAAAGIAVATLIEIMTDPQASKSSRYNAATFVWREVGLSVAREATAVEDFSDSDVLALLEKMPPELLRQALEVA